MPVIDIRDYNAAFSDWKKRAQDGLDDELREGSIHFVGAQTPWSSAGSLAVVYRLKTSKDQWKAIRVFQSVRQSADDGPFRSLSDWIANNPRPYLAQFRYYERGIKVRVLENGKPVLHKAPLIAMDWIEGSTLFTAVDSLCSTNDRAGLADLARRFAELALDMLEDRVAHGDLSAENVLVRHSDASLCLVDYDDLLVPGIAVGSRNVGGQPNYQHPDYQQRGYGAHMDAFSALSIYVSLLALSERPELLGKFNQKRGPDALLFTHDDYRDWPKSRVVAELRQMARGDLRLALDCLEQARALAASEVHFPDPLRKRIVESALERLGKAINTDRDDLILAAWRSRMEAAPGAGHYLGRVQLAMRRRDELALLKTALGRDDDDAIAAAFTPLLSAYPHLDVSNPEKDRIALATRRVTGFANFQKMLMGPHNELDLLSAWSPDLDGYSGLTDHAKDAIRQARRVREMYEDVKEALRSGSEKAICARYVPELERPCFPFTPNERARIERALARRDAFTQFDAAVREPAHNELRISSTWADILAGYPDLTGVHLTKLQLARQQIEALARFRAALTEWVDDEDVVAAYDPVLDTAATLSPDERLRVTDARASLRLGVELARAIADDDDERMVALYQGRHFRLSTGLTVEQHKRILSAIENVELVKTLRDMIAIGDADLAADLVEQAPQVRRMLSPGESAAIDIARARRVLAPELRSALSSLADDEVVRKYASRLDREPHLFTMEETSRLNSARSRVQKAQEARQALGKGRSVALRAAIAGDPLAANLLTAGERYRLAQEVQRDRDLEALRVSMRSGQRSPPIVHFHPELLDHPDLTDAERKSLHSMRASLMAAEVVRHAPDGAHRAVYDVVVGQQPVPYLHDLITAEERARLARGPAALQSPSP